MNPQFEHHAFKLYKFEPNNIILQSADSRKLYRYMEAQESSTQNIQITSELIQKAQRLCSGYIYEKQLSSLDKQIESRLKAQFKEYFDESQLNNTFEPILAFLQADHNYFGLSLESILIDNNGTMKLRDPRLNSITNTEQNQFKKLGLIMLQCALLQNIEQVRQMNKSKQSLAKNLSKFSCKFIANIWILLNMSDNIIRDVEFSQHEPRSHEYRTIIEEIKSYKATASPMKQKKDIFKSIQQKKIIVIPPLNLKFNRVKKPEFKINLSGKSRHHNENENQESLSKVCKVADKMQKIVDIKYYKTSKMLQQKIKLKQKKQMAQHNESPMKKKGKTVDKTKFQQRRN